MLKVNKSSIHPAKRSGFTIVELLIVIVIIAVLAAIVVAAYNGMQKRSRNVAMVEGVRQYAALVESYRATNGTFPIPPGGTSTANSFACLGEGYSQPCVQIKIYWRSGVNAQFAPQAVGVC